MAVPDPQQVAPWYLRNITQALELDEATGNVFVRTNAAVIGNVSVGNVSIGDLGNIDISGNEMPVTVVGNVTVLQGTDPWVVTGNTNVAITSGNVGITGNIAGITANVTVVDGGGSLTVDGNVGILGNVNVTQGTDPWVVSGNVGITGTANVVLADDANVVISGFSGPTSDAFGRLRVSEPYTLFDTRNMYYDHGQFASNLVSSGNVVYNANSSTYLMSVTANGDAVYRETVKTFVYQPGKSLLVLNTFCGNTPAAGLTQRVGYFNDENGIYFEVNGTTKNLVIRSSSTGSLTYETVAQNAWNGDRLDGAGGANNPSGITLNVDRDQIFWMDVEWLGVGSVRTGFVINGQYITCHTFNHANQSGNVTTYMGTANLPCRYELISTGPAGNLRQICSTVISEGGYQLSGEQKSAGHTFAEDVSLPNDDSFVPVFSIRLKSTMPDAVVIPTTWSLSVSSNDLYAWKVYRRAITSGGSWNSAGADSPVEYNLAPTALVSGDVVDEGFIRASNQSVSSPSNQALTFENQLIRDPFTATFYEFVIMAATDGTNQTALAAVQWQQIT
jgi:hypothetical protein